MYGCIVPSAETGASTLLLETMFMKNDVHWFKWDAGKKDYEVVLDQGDQKKRAIETLDYLHELHKFSPEASTYNWAELMSTYVAEKAATSWYVGARLLEQVNANNARIAEDFASLVEDGTLLRYGTPRDQANAVAFLASAAAKFIHGQVLRVDGGFTLFPG
jgi:hypothetical protein